MSIGRFYAMVGALLRRPSDGKYLVLRRSEDKDFASGFLMFSSGLRRFATFLLPAYRIFTTRRGLSCNNYSACF